jgi:hypothetical protein
MCPWCARVASRSIRCPGAMTVGIPPGSVVVHSATGIDRRPVRPTEMDATPATAVGHDHLAAVGAACER